jgi:hypothetical protein
MTAFLAGPDADLPVRTRCCQHALYRIAGTFVALIWVVARTGRYLLTQLVWQERSCACVGAPTRRGE